MNFASDNWAGAHPDIARALTEHAEGYATAYGASELDARVGQLFNDIFEREVAVFLVGTGTAANALSMSWANRPGGIAFCHNEAHLLKDEGGAPEYFTGGGRVRGLEGPLARLEAPRLDAAIREYPAEFVHSGQPMAVSITQATELGTVYPLSQIEAIADVCRTHKLPLHMDGARFANALVGLDRTPAEMTWKSGVDILSFGATKNGCWCAEAVVVFDPGKAGSMLHLRKRAGHLFSKSRFIAAQFLAYFADGLWLDNARHANAMARRLADRVERSRSMRLAATPEANEVFIIMPQQTAVALRTAGFVFYPWRARDAFEIALGKGEEIHRFVTSFATTPADVDGLTVAAD